MQYSRPLDVLDVVKYLESVKAHYFHDAVLYSRFLHLVRDWYRGCIDTVYLIEQISTVLKSKPALLQNFNALLTPQYRIECSTDVEDVEYIVVIMPSGAKIWSTSELSLPPPPPHITHTDDLRGYLSLEHDWKALLDLGPTWASCVLQLLQRELDNPHIELDYKKKCLRCLRKLVQKSDALPPSLFLRNLTCKDEDILAGGGYADIYQGRISSHVVCVKALRTHTVTTKQLRDQLVKEFYHEAIVWRQLCHANVLPFWGVSNDLFPGRLCLVSPWMRHGNVLKYLESNPNHDRLTSVSEVAEGLRYLHEFAPSVVHGDIKGANILVNDREQCCLGDFGLSSITETQRTMGVTAPRGTVRWMAPELVDPNTDSQCTTATDIYALGCTILEIYTGKPPFADFKYDMNVTLAVVNGDRPARPSEVSLTDPVWALIESCWAQQAEMRPTVGQVLASLFDVQNNSRSFREHSMPAPLDMQPTEELNADPPDKPRVTSWLTREFQDNQIRQQKKAHIRVEEERSGTHQKGEVKGGDDEEEEDSGEMEDSEEDESSEEEVEETEEEEEEEEEDDDDDEEEEEEAEEDEDEDDDDSGGDDDDEDEDEDEEEEAEEKEKTAAEELSIAREPLSGGA